jgi:hypothetical protein
MLLNSVLEKYLSDLEKAIRGLIDAYIERYEEEVITSDRINVRIRIRMANESLLEMNEAVVADGNRIRHLGYRYHLQDGKNNLLFRYDNTPHFPELSSYPHHKHLPDSVHESEKPDILNVIDEASSLENLRD